jgi:Fe-S-cluster containining protein
MYYNHFARLLMLTNIQLGGQADFATRSQTPPAAPQLRACRECPSAKVCCTVATQGGQIESPYLLEGDINAIAEALRTPPETFVERRMNLVTRNEIAFVKSKTVQGCRFHNPDTGRCEIYAVRPLDCRLFPLDIAYINGGYHWILWEYCVLAEDDLQELLKFGQSLLPLLGDSLRDYATAPLPGMARTSFSIIGPISFT